MSYIGSLWTHKITEIDFTEKLDDIDSNTMTSPHRGDLDNRRNAVKFSPLILLKRFRLDVVYGA